MSCTKTALIVLTHCFPLSLLKHQNIAKILLSVSERLVPQIGVFTKHKISWTVYNYSDMGQHTLMDILIMVLWSMILLEI